MTRPTIIQEMERKNDIVQLIQDIREAHPNHNVHALPVDVMSLAYIPAKREILLMYKETKILILLTSVEYMALAMGISEETLIDQLKELC